MENDVFAIHAEIESLTIGDITVNGANIEVSTSDSGIANKLMNLIELASASIITMKGRCDHEKDCKKP